MRGLWGADVFIGSQGPWLVSQKQGGGDAGVDAVVVMEGVVLGSLSEVLAEGCQLTGISCLDSEGVGAPHGSQSERAYLYGKAWEYK